MDYLAVYVLGSVGGYLFEVAQGKQVCDGVMTSAGLGCWPMLQIYGLGAVLLLWLARNVKLDLLSLAMLAAVVLTAVECAMGHAATAMHGKRGWRYLGCTFCSGYNALHVSAVWFVISLVVLAIYRAIFPAPP